jgi:hypothetical protein
MIEAVKSTVASSVLQRGSVDQSSTLNSFAANPDKVQNVSQAPYVSPTVRVDVNTKIAILEFRESDTGQVVAQIPSEQAIRTYKLREAKEDAQLLAKLTQKSGTQNGPVPTSNSVSPQPAHNAQPAPQPSTSTVSAPEPDASLAAELNAITTQLVEVQA